jgi:CRP/FNR family nitrogen fixation transcriptional regulator
LRDGHASAVETIMASPEAYVAHYVPFVPPATNRGWSGARSDALSFYPAGAEIYAQGEKSGNLYRIEFGAVRVHRLLADGRRQISAFHLAGDIFGFEADPCHHFFAEAINATGIRVVRIACCDRTFADELLPIALQGLVRAQEHLLVLGRQNAAERVATFLTDMCERCGGLRQFDLPMSRSDIADYLGLTFETVSRAISKLKERGIIRLPGQRSIEIMKPQTLKEMIE